MKRYANYLAGVGYAAIFGFSFLVTKGALAVLDTFELLFLRFALAALLMGVLALAGLIKLEYRGKPRRDLAFACLFQPLLYFACETLGLRESASSTAGIVLGALPAAVAVLGSFMLKERLSTRQAASLGLSIAGVALIVIRGAVAGAGEGAEGSARGLAFLLGAVASATFFNIYSRKASRHYGPFETTFAMMATGAVVFGAIALVRGALAGNLAGPGGLASRAASAWPGVLYLGALSSVVAFFLVNFTLSRLMASQSVVFANLTTVISVAAGVVIRGERFDLVQALGAAMIVLGVWGTNAAARRRRPAGS